MMNSCSPDMLTIVLTGIQAGAALLQTIILGITLRIAYKTIKANEKISCKRATIDLLVAEQTNHTWIENRNTFIKLKEQGPLAEWKSHGTEYSIIKNYLNRYEIIAVGIKEGALSEEVYKLWWRSALVEDWIKSKSYISEMRIKRNIPTLYANFEKLARKWAATEEEKNQV